MAESDPLNKLGYILHLLEDLKYFHHTNAHACSCDICSKKTSLVKSSISTAIDEVKNVTSLVRASPGLSSAQNSPAPSNATAGSSAAPICSPPTNCQVVNDCLPGENLSQQTSGLKMEGMEKRLATPLVHHYSNTCSSLLSSTHRDSGVHTENFLHSTNSISPIKSSELQDSSSESSDSESRNRRPNQHKMSKSSCPSACSYKTDQQRNKQGGKHEPETGFKNFLVPQYLNSDSPHSEQIKSPVFLWPGLLPMMPPPHFSQIFPLYRWSPLQNHQFAASFNYNNPQFSSPLAAANAEKSPEIFHDNATGGLYPNTMSVPQDFSSFQANYNSWNFQTTPDVFSKGSDKPSDVGTTVPSSQMVEIKDSKNAEDYQHLHQDEYVDKNVPLLPQIFETSIASTESVKPLCSKDYSDAILRKDVMLNQVRGPSDNDTINCDLSSYSDCSHANASDIVNSKDVSGVMWRPWEAKEDVLKIISDLSIEEEDSAEMRSTLRSNSSDNKPSIAPVVTVEEERSHCDNNLVEKKDETHDVSINVGMSFDHQSKDSEPTSDSSAITQQRGDDLEKSNHQKAELAPTSSEDTAMLSESENKDNFNQEQIGEGNIQITEKSQHPKENCQILDLVSPIKITAQRSLAQTNLQDISNTMKDSESNTNNGIHPKIICEDKSDEKENLAMDELIKSTCMLDIVKPASKSSDNNTSKSPFRIKQINQRKLSNDENIFLLGGNPYTSAALTRDENIFILGGNPYSSAALKGKSFKLEGTNESSNDMKSTVDSAQANCLETQERSPSKQAQTDVTSSAQFPCMGMSRKLDFLNSSPRSRKSCLNIEHKSLQKSQSDSTLAEKNSLMFDQSDSYDAGKRKALCTDQTSSFKNISDKNLSALPKWGAPAIIESPRENVSDHRVPTNVEQMLLVGKNSNSEEQSRAPHFEYKQNETKCLEEINSQSLNCKADICSQNKDDGMNLRDYIEETVKGKELFATSMEQTESNCTQNDKRSRITALCHDFLQFKLDSNCDQLNRSFPVSCPIQAHPQGNMGALGSVSFEANQSFPKMGRPMKEQPHVLGTFEAKNQDALDWYHASTPFKCDVVTPRNRRSIFGLSPPEQTGLHVPLCLSSEKEQNQLESRSESPSFSSHTEEEHLYLNLDNNVWEGLDLSDRFPRLPTLKEILFNCVTGSICLIDLHRKGKIISVNESFQFLIGLHEKVVGQRLFRFIKIRHMVKTLATSVPHKIILSDGSVTTVCGKLVSCVVATGEEMPVSIWTIHLQSHPDIVACMINIAPTLEGNFYVTNELDFIEVEDDKSVPLKDSVVTPCVCGVLTGLLVVRSDGVIQNFDYCFFHIFLEHDELKDIHISELFTQIVKTKEENRDEKPQDGSLNSSEDMLASFTQGLGDVNRLTEMQACHDQVAETDGLLLPIVCFAEEQSGNFSHLSNAESLNRSEKSSQDKEDFDLNDSEGCERLPASFSIPQTSTPCKKEKPEVKESPSAKNETAKMTNGIYSASFLHGNGSYIDVSMKMSSILTVKDEKLFCVWVYIQQEESSFESDSDEVDSDEEENSDEEEENNSRLELDAEARKKTKDSCATNKDSDKMSNISLGQMLTDQAVLNQSHNATNEEVLDLEQGVSGSFSEHYVTLGTLGQGSFGFVRRARPICGEPKSVVVKFIRKRSMFDDAWVYDGDKVMPCEVTILRVLNSEHIVKVLDVHQNNDFVQMVMEDFGELDLFDFIDQVDIDEALACFIFRQIISGVEYLHSNKILHRDIKDENVIINSSFQCKLIDFGSAAYMLPPGQLFDKFRGTLEYCSPEIHLSKRYRGPELDAWALGVTLYTMVFRENPYTADCIPFQMMERDFPFSVSKDLASLLLGLMCCDPCKRFSVTKALGTDWLRQIVDMSKYDWEDLLGSAPDIKSCDELED